MPNPDIETGDEDRAPLLERAASTISTCRGRSHTRVQEGIEKPKRPALLRLVYFFSGGIYALDASTYDPIEILLNTEDRKERDFLTERWKDNRVKELNFVGIVVCFLFSFQRL